MLCVCGWRLQPVGGGLHVMCEQMLLQLNMQLSIKVELVEVVLDHSHLKI